jgi:exopolysaccharide biosynthesis protein
MINFRHPRSAICQNQEKHLFFVAIDGRCSQSDGLTMPELAKVMQALNCVDAMNLDGGGSTLLYANNKIINKPSDATGPRKVVSVVLIRDRYKKKANLKTI